MGHLEKSWLLPLSGRRKFFMTTLTHCLAKALNSNNYEVVYEGFIDPTDTNSEQPDILIYDLNHELHPVQLIEFCSEQSEVDTLRTVEILSKIYHIEESFVYNLDSADWQKFTEISGQHSHSSFSDLLRLNLNEILSDGINRYVA